MSLAARKANCNTTYPTQQQRTPWRKKKKKRKNCRIANLDLWDPDGFRTDTGKTGNLLGGTHKRKKCELRQLGKSKDGAGRHGAKRERQDIDTEREREREKEVW